jgi:hypothetical protein
LKKDGEKDNKEEEKEVLQKSSEELEAINSSTRVTQSRINVFHYLCFSFCFRFWFTANVHGK